MKKNTFVLSLILMGLCLQAFSITIHADENDLILITDSNIYFKYGFKDLGIYYTENSLISFNMPFIVSKTNLGNITNKDMSNSISGSIKDKVILTTRNPVYSYSVLAENKDYYVLNYHMSIKASNQSFSIDFVPKIKGVSYNSYAWWNSTFNYYKPITINHLQVPNTLINFPVLINLSSDTDLANDAQNDGDDIAFVSIDNVTQYNHEIEYFNGTTGQLITWVNVTVLSSVSDTIILMYYKNSGCSNQQHITDTWDSNYVWVYHMKDATTAIINDSTVNAGTGSKVSANHPVESATSMVYKSEDFAGRVNPCTDNINSTTTFGATVAFTLEAWINIDNQAAMEIYSKRASSGDYPFDIWVGATYKIRLAVDPGTQCYMDDAEAGTALTTGKWYYAVGKYDNSKIYTYLNSVFDYSKSASGTLPSISEPLKIGAWSYSWTNSQCFDGKMDEVRISNICRNVSWISCTYNTMKNATNGSFYTIGVQQEKPVTSVTNATNFLPVNNSNFVLIETNFSCDISENGSKFITWTLQCSNGYSSNGGGYNGTIYLNFTNANSLYHNYTVWINLTNDNSTYRRFYTEFRTGIDYYNQSESETRYGGIVIFDNYQFFLCLLFTFWLFLLAESIKESYYGLLQFFIAIPIMSMILTNVYLSSLSLGTMIFSTIVSFVVLFIGIIVFIINWFK